MKVRLVKMKKEILLHCTWDRKEHKAIGVDPRSKGFHVGDEKTGKVAANESHCIPSYAAHRQGGTRAGICSKKTKKVMNVQDWQQNAEIYMRE